MARFAVTLIDSAYDSSLAHVHAERFVTGHDWVTFYDERGKVIARFPADDVFAIRRAREFASRASRTVL